MVTSTMWADSFDATPSSFPDARNILVVDDEAAIRRLVSSFFEREGYTCWIASTGEKAVNMFRDHASEIGLALIDVRMPGMDGVQTLTALKKINPELRCCFMTGNCAPYHEADLFAAGAAELIHKPVSLSVLGQIARDCLASV